MTKKFDLNSEFNLALSPATVTQKHLDFSVLEELKKLQIEGEPNIVEAVIIACFDNIPTLIRRLKNALEVKDHQLMESAAHTLKSGSINIGAIHLNDISKKLEQICREKTIDGTKELINDIEDEFKLVKKILTIQGHISTEKKQ